MPGKKNSKKVITHKKLIRSLPNMVSSVGIMGASQAKGHEAAIIRQFHQIQKGYFRLMNDIVKEMDLVKGWIGTQALSKKNELKNKLSSRLTRE